MVLRERSDGGCGDHNDHFAIIFAMTRSAIIFATTRSAIIFAASRSATYLLGSSFL